MAQLGDCLREIARLAQRMASEADATGKLDAIDLELLGGLVDRLEELGDQDDDDYDDNSDDDDDDDDHDDAPDDAY